MKADPFVQLRLLDLQALDSALDRLAHKRRTLREIAEIARLDGLLEARSGDVALAETAVSDLQRELDKAEADIEQVRVRKARDEDRLGSGAITAPKQLEELQHEIATLARRQSDLEDAELEVMERMEQAQAALDALVAERAAHDSDRSGAVQARDAAWAEIDADVERASAERTTVAAEIPADLLALYEKIRAAEGGVGAGPIERGRCGGCRLDLMNNEKADFRAAPVDEVLRHEGCGRILVRTAESGL
ncbi:MAG: C4-type zinc ribbon domain-containing protein [Mycobacteriales bacterium]